MLSSQLNILGLRASKTTVKYIYYIAATLTTMINFGPRLNILKDQSIKNTMIIIARSIIWRNKCLSLPSTPKSKITCTNCMIKYILHNLIY